MNVFAPAKKLAGFAVIIMAAGTILLAQAPQPQEELLVPQTTCVSVATQTASDQISAPMPGLKKEVSRKAAIKIMWKSIENNVLHTTPISEECQHAVKTSRFRYLNFSPFFVTETLLDSPLTRKYLLAPFIGNGRPITATTKDGTTIDGLFFNRNSSNLLVIGTGFGNELEKVAPLIHVFDTYDIILFNYRGHGSYQPKITSITALSDDTYAIVCEELSRVIPFLQTQRIPNLDVSKSTFGAHEEEDLLAMIELVTEQKQYENTFGIGFCFSTYIFTKAAAQNPNLFTKLVLDSSVYSLKNTLHKSAVSPQLLSDPQRGADQILLKNSTQETNLEQKNLILKPLADFLDQIIKNATIPETTTGAYLSQLEQLPILFFHGKKDIMTQYETDFLQNWNAAATPHKFAIIFEDTTHLTDYIKHKELWAWICKSFFENSPQEFVSVITKKPTICIEEN